MNSLLSDAAVRYGRHAPARTAGLVLLAAFTLLLLHPSAFAAPAGNTAVVAPWEGGIKTVVNSICGPYAQGAAILAIVGSGLAIAFSEVKGWIHTMLIVLLGVGIAVKAPSFLGLFTNLSSAFTC